MKTIAQGMEAKKIKVLMIVNLDPASGAAIEQQAKKNGIITVDYDRLTPGGGASLYVSFDNVKVGVAQGTALTQCSQVKGKSAVQYAQIDGAATDNNATLFRAGLRERSDQDQGLDQGCGAERQLGRPDRRS